MEIESRDIAGDVRKKVSILKVAEKEQMNGYTRRWKQAWSISNEREFDDYHAIGRIVAWS
jgi:hypothetical protein